MKATSSLSFWNNNWWFSDSALSGNCKYNLFWSLKSREPDARVQNLTTLLVTVVNPNYPLSHRDVLPVRKGVDRRTQFDQSNQKSLIGIYRIRPNKPYWALPSMCICLPTHPFQIILSLLQCSHCESDAKSHGIFENLNWLHHDCLGGRWNIRYCNDKVARFHHPLCFQQHKNLMEVALHVFPKIQAKWNQPPLQIHSLSDILGFGASTNWVI